MLVKRPLVPGGAVCPAHSPLSAGMVMRISRTTVIAAAALTLAACSESTSPVAPVSLAGARLAMTPGSITEVVIQSDISVQLINTAPSTLKAWTLFTRDGGSGVMVAGPATPPGGTGSFGMSTPLSNDKATLFNYEHIGTPLSSVGAIAYSTYRTAGSLQQVAALNIEVDFNGPAAAHGFTTLVFEPVYNTGQGLVVSGVWQRWDAFDGGAATWWSTKPIPGVCAFSCFVSWNAIIAANPDATILGGVGINQGGGNPGLSTSVDNFTLGYGGNSVTYDFEQFRTPSSLQSCMKEGWMTLTTATGAAFKNQGQCIQYFNTGK